MEYGLSLGSNLGDRLGFLRSARSGIARLEGVSLLASAPVYETDPVDVPEAYKGLDFLNTILIVETGHGPEALFAALRNLETALGRTRGGDRNAARNIDIDMIYADALMGAWGDLRLPHPRWHERRFVVEPLARVRAGLVLPGQTKTVAEIMAELPAKPAARLMVEEW